LAVIAGQWIVTGFTGCALLDWLTRIGLGLVQGQAGENQQNNE
jgi:hypothetical protein